MSDTPTKAEQERIDRMKLLGCPACAFLEIVNVACDLHHILIGGIRAGHWYTIFLCPGHHRGAWGSEQLELIEPYQRVAISDGRKAFTRIYPSEREMWEMVQARLKLPAHWPISKITPRMQNGQ
jgi:hypothetical protein